MAIFSRRSKKQKQEAWMSAEERAARGLNAALSRVKESEAEVAEHLVLVDEDLKRKQLTQETVKQDAREDAEGAVVDTARSERKSLRILFITTETSLFTKHSNTQTEYVALAEYLDEIHIIVLTLRNDASYRPLRIAPNVWVYPTNSRSRMFALYDIYTIAKKQLAFAAGFRADLVVAADAFEAGVAAYAIARRYDCPLQLQMAHDPFAKAFMREQGGNRWRALIARLIIPRADCLFVRSKQLHAQLLRRYRFMEDRIIFLPVFHNLSSFRDDIPSFNLHERYPQFKFIILAVMPLDARSRANLVIDICMPLLRQYITIGLVIVGDGILRQQLEKKVLAADLQNRIRFESATDDLVSHMKTANLFLNVTAGEEEDALVAAAAAAGLPVVTTKSSMADMLFEDGVSAFVCPENDMVCFQARIGEFLSNNQLRSTFTINARSQVFSVVEQDVASYRKAFVEGCESCVLAAYTEENSSQK